MTDLYGDSVPGPDNEPRRGPANSLTLLNRLREAVVAFADGPVPEDGGACAEQVDVLLDLEDITRTATDVRIGTVDATGAYRVHGRGYKSMNAWLTSGCRMNTYQGAIRARNGRQHRQHPEVFPHIGRARQPDPNTPTDPNAPADQTAANDPADPDDPAEPDDPDAPPGLSPADRLTYEAVVLVFKGTQRLEFALRGRKAQDIRDVTGTVVTVEAKIEEYKAILLTLARDAKNLQAIRMGVDYLYDVIDPDGHLSAWERAENRRYMEYTIGDDGCMTGKFCLPPDTAAKLKAYLDQAAKPAGPEDTRTRTQRLADALRAFIESRVQTEAVVLFDAASLVDNPHDPNTPTPDERGCTCGHPHPDPSAPAAPPSNPTSGESDSPAQEGDPAPGQDDSEAGQNESPAGEADSAEGEGDSPADSADPNADEGDSPTSGSDSPTRESESPTDGANSKAADEGIPAGEDGSGTRPDSPSAEGDSPAREDEPTEADDEPAGHDDPAEDDPAEDDPGLRTGWGGRPGPRGTTGHDPDGNDKTSKTLQDVLTRLRDYDPLRDDPALAGQPVDRACPSCGQSVYDNHQPGNSSNGIPPNGNYRRPRSAAASGISPYSKPALMVATGQWIPATVARHQLFNARITRLILGFPSIPLDHSRAKRLATDYQRRMILALYDTCPYDDCPVPAADCQLDHPYPWCEYHRTRSDELNPACPFHNGDRAANPDKYKLSIINGLYHFTTRQHWQRR